MMIGFDTVTGELQVAIPAGIIIVSPLFAVLTAFCTSVRETVAAVITVPLHTGGHSKRKRYAYNAKRTIEPLWYK
jgi:hypothetical protein